MKKTLLAVALLALIASPSFADALLFTVNATPYDKQMDRIRPVLATPSRSSVERRLHEYREQVDG